MKTKRQLKNKIIPQNDPVRVKLMGNIVEIVHSDKYSNGGSITKLSKDEFLDNRTGEIREFNHLETRQDDLENVAKSLSRLRDYLNTNVTEPENCRWLTLTYAENMTDPEKLKWDFKNFNRKCREVYGRYEYITAAEPQGRGAWHLHAVLVFPCKAPYMKNETVAQLWGKGFVSVQKLKNVDNVGAYLTAYLGDMELNEYLKINPETIHLGEIKEQKIEENGKTVTKRFIKGARLSMYPPGFHLYRCSAGIKKPQVYQTSYGKARESLGGAKLTYRRSVEITRDDFSTTVTHEFYNKKRKNEEESE